MRAKFIEESLMNTEPRAGRYTYMKEEDASLNEMNFERGEDPRKTLGLESITINLIFQDFPIDEDKLIEDGILTPDMSDSENKRTVNDLNRIGVQWKITGEENSPPGFQPPTLVQIRGTRRQIAEVIGEIYLGERDINGIEKIVNKWNGKNSEKLLDMLQDEYM